MQFPRAESFQFGGMAPPMASGGMPPPMAGSGYPLGFSYGPSPMATAAMGPMGMVQAGRYGPSPIVQPGSYAPSTPMMSVMTSPVPQSVQPRVGSMVAMPMARMEAPVPRVGSMVAMPMARPSARLPGSARMFVVDQYGVRRQATSVVTRDPPAKDPLNRSAGAAKTEEDPWLQAALGQATKARTAVAVVGAGFMGRGIAACLAAGGADVTLYDVSADAVGSAVKAAAELVAFLRENVLHREPGALRGATSLAEAVQGAAFVFEAVFEDVQVKQAIFEELAGLTEPGVPLCTNTSSLSITEIAAGVTDPAARARVLAAHFIGPAHLVPLVEVCPASTTAEGLVGKVADFLRSMGKAPTVLKKEIQGFLAARLQAALYRESMHIYLEGVAEKDAIDQAVVNGFGRRLNQIGPFQVADFAGIDLVVKTHATFFPTLGAQPRDELADVLVPAGHFGAKNGKGHYDWPAARVQEVSKRRDGELLRRLQADFAK